MKSKIEIGKRYRLKDDAFLHNEHYPKGLEITVSRNRWWSNSECDISGYDDEGKSYHFYSKMLEPAEQDEPKPSKPAHYDTGIDTIAFMRANCPPEQVEGFLRGNALKYLQRYDKKNGLEDLKKARHYIEMLIEEVEGR